MVVEKIYIADKPTQDQIKHGVDNVNLKVDVIGDNVGQLLNGRVVKSVQRGIVTMGLQSNVTNVPISVVNLTKCDITFFGFYTPSNSTGSPTLQVYLQSVTTTQLTFATDYNIIGSVKVNWQVVEYY